MPQKYDATNSHDVLLTTAEAAAFLKIGKSTLERYRLTGTPAIPYVKIGGKRGPVLYRLGDLRAFIAASLRTSTSAVAAPSEV